MKPPRVQPLQDILAISELAAIINATRKLSYQVYFLTTYSLGLRLSEALHLQVADIDGTLMRVSAGVKIGYLPLIILGA